MRPQRRSVPLRAVGVLALVLVLASCGRNMAEQPSARAFEASPFFADGSVQQRLLEGTVSRERGGIDASYFSGQDADGLMRDLPFDLTLEVVQRGKERYDIYCSVCHGYTGEGDGMIVQRGFPQPSSFQQQRLLDAPVGYYVGVITNGFGRMFPYASRVPPEDRWAIAAYVKALQLSQNASVDDVPDAALRDLGDSTPTSEGSVRR
ncbi:MAG: cytochrome c [Trueperaceae bacterium]|nr:cytochrome c [Trueperaceae bacterium]